MEHIYLKQKNIADVLREHAMRYPEMTPRDLIKLIYQSTFGPGHMVSDKNSAIQFLHSEMVSANTSESPITENIGGDYSRIYLRKIDGLSSEESADLIGNLFICSAEDHAGSLSEFMKRLETTRKVVEERIFSFNSDEFERYVEEYMALGMPPVSHSEIYRKTYHPAYRVIRHEFAEMLHVLAELKKKGQGIIAIDGFCASGKTTFAEKLAKLLKANLIHTDDFFLPPEKRTEKRFNEPGGNVDYERFKAEVIDSLESEFFSYGIFDCSEMKITETKTICKTNYTIIEGAYSHHQYFGNYADVRLFFDISYDEQLKRLLRRDGEKALEMFINRWIPFEKKYEKAFDIKMRADYVIDTTN